MMHMFRWHRTTAFVLLLCLALAAFWDFLFWGQPVGISAALFTAAVALLLLLRTPALRQTAQGRIIAALTLLAIGALVEEPSSLAILMVLVTMGTLVLIGQRDLSLVRDSVQAWAGRWMLLAVTLWIRIVRDNALVARWFMRRRRVDRRFTSVVTAAAWWVLPLVAGALFLGLFAFANPVIGQFFSHLWEYVDTFFIWLINLSFMRMGLWLLIGVLAYGVMRHRHSWRSRVQPPPVVRTASMEWLTGPQMIVRLLLVMNLVFLVENVLDAAYLYGGVPLPTGLTYKEYSHRGAYTLIATALLAGIFTLISFRAGGTAHRSRACRWLVYAWIVQNILLLISTIVRVWIFVDTTELTRLRTSTMIWCGIVAAGFGWIILRIKHAKSNAWLWRMNAFTALGVLFVCAFINFDGMIADFNVRHCAQSGGNGYRLDMEYVEHLGPQALSAAMWMRAHPGTMDAAQRDRLDEITREIQGQLADELRDWRGWSLRRWRAASVDAKVEVAHRE